MRPLPQVLQHGANSIWKSCSQYFRPSSCKRGQQTEDKEGTVIPRAALARLLGEDLPSGTLDKHPTLCTCYHHRKLGGGGRCGEEFQTVSCPFKAWRWNGIGLFDLGRVQSAGPRRSRQLSKASPAKGHGCLQKISALLVSGTS